MAHRRFFDAEFYRIIVLDQRGSGRSTPYADTTDNSTQHLIADMETLRRHLAVDKWLVFGGSWGSALALAYGIAHPERVSAFVLRGIFLCRNSELDWFLHGISQVFPERHREFVEFLPEAERGDLLAAYHRRLTSPDASINLPAARVWARFEGACSTLLPNPRNVAGFDSGRAALALARLEAHYFVHKLFVPDDHFFAHIDCIRHIPAVMVQGRYDMICPIATAEALHRAWPEADYVVVPDAGHSAMEPSIRSALVAATEKFKRGI